MGVAVLQTVLGERLSGRYHDDYWITVGIAWTAAIVLAREGQAQTQATAGAPARVLGAAVATASIVPLVAVPVYHAFHRALPLVAGIGMCLFAFGPRGLRRHRSELLLLTLPVINPFPERIRMSLAPTSWIAECASAIGRIAGHAMTADGSVIVMPTGTLDVLPDCAGLLSVTRLWVLAAIVMALFPTNTRQKVALVTSSLVIAFVANAVRLEMLAVVVAQGNTGSFDYWHDGAGASVFALTTTAIAGCAWWLFFPAHKSDDGDSRSARTRGSRSAPRSTSRSA